MTIKITYDYRRDVSEVSVPAKKVKGEDGKIKYVTYRPVGLIGAIRKKNYGRSNAISRYNLTSSIQNPAENDTDSSKKNNETSVAEAKPDFKDSVLRAIIDNELDYFLNIILNKQYTYMQKVSSEEFTPSADEIELIRKEEKRLNERWKEILEEALSEYNMKLKKSKGSSIVQSINAGLRNAKKRKAKKLESDMAGTE